MASNLKHRVDRKHRIEENAEGQKINSPKEKVKSIDLYEPVLNKAMATRE